MSSSGSIGNTPLAGRKKRSAWRKFWIGLALLVLLLLVAAAVSAWYEIRQSRLQARYFSEFAGNSGFRLEAGPNPDLWLPRNGPYDLRLGYGQMKYALPQIEQAGFEIERQARQSAGFAELVGRGIYPIYREKTAAGLTLIDRSGQVLYSERYPERRFDTFDAIPGVLVNALIYVENRELLNADLPPMHNPAVEWDRAVWAVFTQAWRKVDPDTPRAGGSTLATQIEKFRHSPGGRTHDAGEKLRQMVSASLRAYREGPDTRAARKLIALDFLNSVPLGAVPGHGEVIGIGDGMYAWFGRDFDTLRQLLAHPESRPAEAGQYFKEVLALIIAQRRPSDLLGESGTRLEALTDSYLRLLEREQLIPTALRDAALAARLAPRRDPLHLEPVSFVERKAVNATRLAVAKLLGVDDLYALDRYDLSVRTTLDGNAQQRITQFLNDLKSADFVAARGFKAHQLLEHGDPADVRYSFTLYEVAPQGNLLRVQADNLDQPLDINAGTKLDLGSSAKFRTLVTYLDVIAQLHARLTALSEEELGTEKPQPNDRLTLWALGHLRGAKDKGLQAMLQAALERTYSANPEEVFFTGGGEQVFENFKHDQDGMAPTLREALAQSINLPFIRLMRDLVHYYAYEAAGAPGRGLAQGSEELRRQFLERFADKESRGFLAGFWHKYHNVEADELLDTLARSVQSQPRRVAAAFLAVDPAMPFGRFSELMGRRLGERAGGEAELRKIHKSLTQNPFNLSDWGYLSRVHPIELWLVRYLDKHPDARLDEVYDASAEARQEAYRWLFKSGLKRAQNVRIAMAVEAAAFEKITAQWRSVGYPFERLVPSLATAIGSSADRPAALAELMGVIINGGVRRPVVSIERFEFAAGTPFETQLGRRSEEGTRVLDEAVASVARAALLGVVEHGTARRVSGTFRSGEGEALAVGGKTGTGDHRFNIVGPGGRKLESRVVNRAATFAFFLGDRHFGTITAFVPGRRAANYEFTSALPVQVLKTLEPALRGLVAGHELNDEELRVAMSGPAKLAATTVKSPTAAGAATAVTKAVEPAPTAKPDVDRVKTSIVAPQPKAAAPAQPDTTKPLIKVEDKPETKPPGQPAAPAPDPSPRKEPPGQV
ncbi:MAG: transglycosylase domain-containing protein [Rhodocyclaceae bacterium]|nr:transglycosylase domain-containing protein [Rhodocyclaceae bacterium]MBX3668403.1 transglycosylase domain-containing protein [Rhodocyclaceae bacterium]